MTVEELHRQINAAFNSGDWEAFAAAYGDDSVVTEVPTGRQVRGAAAIVDLARGSKHPFPDLVGEITNGFDCDDWGVLEVAWRGTHTGALTAPDGQVIPATNRVIEHAACYVTRRRGDKVLEQRWYFDQATVMRQLGLLPDGG